MQDNEILKDMKEMAYHAGDIALRIMEDNAPVLKPDKSVLTKADMEISQFIKQRLSKYLGQEDYLYIDEEDEENSAIFNQETIHSAPYLWVIDPIDGTRGYSNRMPTYGISIGLLKECRPWMGAVYFPCQKELFYCDGEHSYYVANANSENEQQTQIIPIDQDITQLSVFLGNEAFFTKFDWDFSFCQVMMPSCAVIDLCWPTIGRGCGCFFKANIWDFAGCWPIFQSAGLQLRTWSKGTILDYIETDLFTGKDDEIWKLKEHYILSSERNFPLIKDKIKLKS